MSVAVELEALGVKIAEWGPAAFLVTVAGDGRPHLVSVQVTWDGRVLSTSVGATSAANAVARPEVSLLWPAPDDSDYALIVDGTATVDGEDRLVTVAPARAVLHRTVTATSDGPGCITVVARPGPGDIDGTR